MNDGIIGFYFDDINDPSTILNMIMREYLLVLMILSFSSLFGQIDFDEHINSIVKAADGNSTMNENERTVRYAIRYLRNNGINKKYITNRKLLRELRLYECIDFSRAYFYTKFENKNRIEVIIDFEQITSDDYILENIGGVNKIDDHKAYGAYYGNPSVRIASIDIRFNRKSIHIPKSAYSKFFEIAQCDAYDSSISPVEVYSSNDGEYVFIYLRGGEAANNYFAKLIFGRSEGYITDIVADYVTLSRLGAFHKDFVGF